MVAEPVAPEVAYHLDGVYHLLGGFWQWVHADLQHGCHETAAWLLTEDFVRWLRASGSDLDHDTARRRLMDLYWPSDQPRPWVYRREG